MRSGYSDELSMHELALYRANVDRAMQGERGQRMLRDLLLAMDAMPVKRLIAEELVDAQGEVCLLGAGGRLRKIDDIATLDPEDHRRLAERFDVARCLIQEIEYVNDEASFAIETPENRFERVRRWLVDNIKP